MGFTIGVRKEAEGVGRPVLARACVMAWREGLDILWTWDMVVDFVYGIMLETEGELWNRRLL